MIEQTCKSLKDFMSTNKVKIQKLEDSTLSLNNLKISKAEFMNETIRIESDYNSKINNQNTQIKDLTNRTIKIEELFEFTRSDLEKKIEADIERMKNWILTKTSKNEHRIDDLELHKTNITQKLDMNLKHLQDAIDSLVRDTKHLQDCKLENNGIDKLSNDLSRLLKDFYSFKAKAEDLNSDEGGVDISLKFNALKDQYQTFVKEMENFINYKYEKQINSINDSLRDSSTKNELNNVSQLHKDELANKLSELYAELDIKMDEKAVRALIELLEKRKEPPYTLEDPLLTKRPITLNCASCDKSIKKVNPSRVDPNVPVN